MMIAYIISIVMFVFQVYILKHTYYINLRGKPSEWNKDYIEENLEPVEVHLYVIILMALFTIFPYLFWVSSGVFWSIWLCNYSNPVESDYDPMKVYTYWRLRDKFLMRKI